MGKTTSQKFMTKIASPLYIVREECEKDLFSVLKKISEMGYDGVEFLGFFGKKPDEIRKKLDELHLIALGNHVDYNEFLKNIDVTIKIHKEIGCKYITISGISKDKIDDEISLTDYISNVIAIGAACQKQGITLLYHNHDHEFLNGMKGNNLLEKILDQTTVDSLSLEPDLGWMAIGGTEPEYFLDKYKERCPVVHLKDFYAEDITRIGNVHELDSKKGDVNHSFFEFRPIGYGIMNTPALIKKVMMCDPEWVVADHDLAYDRDSYVDLKISLDYIKNLLLIY